MANDKITLLKHFELLAMRCAAMVTSKIAELATSVTAALEEMDENKLSIGDRADIPSGTDLNTLTTPGCYKASTVLLVNSLVNLPSSFMDSNLFLDVYKSNDHGNVCQRISSTTDAYIAVRVLNGTTWGEWDTSYSESHKPTASELGVVPRTRTVNGKSLDANITLTAGDVSAVPTSRTINGKALSSDISLTVDDVGAAASGHTHTPANIGAVGIMQYNDDVNGLIEDGFYRVGTNANLPDALWYGQIIVSKGLASDTVAQIGISYTSGKMYSRGANIVNGVANWSSWNEMVGADHEHSGYAPAYQYGTADLTAGSSALPTGTLYFVYE